MPQLIHEGVVVTGFGVSEANLEEIFMRVTQESSVDAVPSGRRERTHDMDHSEPPLLHRGLSRRGPYPWR